MVSSNIGSYSKRIVTSSCIFIGYCVGNIIGPLTALESEAPRYQTAAYSMMAGYILKTICHGLLWFYVSVLVDFRHRWEGADERLVDVA